MKSLRSLFATALASTGLALAALGSAHAQSYTIRVPVLAAVHAPTTSTFDFGSVVVGSQPSRVFTFTNRSSSPTSMGAVMATGNARIVSHSCTGVLEPNATCDLTLGLAVQAVGTNSGSVSVAHSEGATPDIYSMTAKGTLASAGIGFDQSSVNFGNQLLREASAPQELTLRNRTNEPAYITKIYFTSSTYHYVIQDNSCEGELAPNSSCTVSVAFKPQSLGPLNATLGYILESGDKVPAVSLQGVGVKAIPVWSAESVNFVGVPTGQRSAPQTLTLSNSGQGVLGITALTVRDNSGESPYFSIAASTCSALLLPGASCQVSVDFMAPDSSIRSATLQLEATGTASVTNPSVQLFAQPAQQEGLLSLEPASLSFGNVPVGTSKTLTLAVRSVGQLPVNVSGYTLTGSGQADYSLVNQSECTGSLNPGMQCVLQVKVTPSAGGSRLGSLTLTHDAAQPVASVPLSSVGTLGELQVSPATLSFPATVTGSSTSLNVTLTNIGVANLTVSSVSTASTTTGVAGFFAPAATCTGKVLAPGASCVVSVTYSPLTVAAHSATMTIANTGKAPTMTVALSGAGSAPPVAVAALSDFACPAPAQVGVPAACTATLSNPGTVPFTFTAPGTSNVTALVPSVSGCTSPLAPGASCAVKLQGTFTKSGPVSAVYSITTSASANALTKTVNFTVEAPRASLTTVTHGTVTVGGSSSASHTLTNQGNFPLTLPTPATLATGSIAAYSVTGNTCGTSLAVGASCQITTQCAPTVAGTLTATLNVPSNAETPITGALSCLGVAPPPATTGLRFSPTPADFSVLPVGATLDKTITLTNTNATGSAAVGLGALTISGAQSSEFAVKSRGSCGTTLAAGASCWFVVSTTPAVSGLRSATLTLATSLTGTAPTLPLSVTGISPTFTVSPASVDFGTIVAGSSGSRTLTLTNTGGVSATLTAVTVSPSSSPLFLFSGTCVNGRVMPPGDSCTRVVWLDTSAAAAALRGTQSGAVVFSFSGGAPTQTVAVTANVSAPAVAAGNVALACPASTGLSTLTSCKATITSTGGANLTVTSWGLSQRTGTASAGAVSTSTVTCSATGVTVSSIPPGQSCSVNLSFTPTVAAEYTVTAAPRGNASMTPATARVTVAGPSLSLSTVPHTDTQVGASTTASHTLTNTGPVTVSISGVTSSLPAITVNRTGCTTLTSGQSCTLVTTCTPSTTGALTATLNVSGMPAVRTSGTVSCAGVAGNVTATYEPNQTSTAGGFTNSGNWVRLTNKGVGPVTVQGLFPATGWTLTGNTALTSTCAINRVIQPGQSCLVLEALNATQGPGLTVTGSQRVRTTVGDVFWTANPMKTLGLEFVAVTPFGNLQGGDVATATYTVTNKAPVPTAAAITFKSSNAALVVSGTTCPTALASGASCQVTLRYTVPLTSTVPLSATVTATTSYMSLVNGQVQTNAPRLGQQGSLTVSAAVQAPKVTLATGTNTRINVGQTALITHTLTNEGVSPVKLTGVPTLSVNPQHSLSGGTCALNLVLNPGQSCTVVTQFKPTTSYQAAVTLTINTSVGLRSGSFTGQVVQQSDVRVTLTGVTTSQVDKTNSYTLSVFNGTGGPSKVVVTFGVTNNGGAQAYLSTLTGGVCGTWSFTAAGAATQTAAPSAANAGVTCTAKPATRQLELVMTASRSYTATLSVPAGATPGSVRVSAAAAVSDVEDTNLTNNSAAVTTTLTYPLADLGVTLSTSPTTVSYNWTEGVLTATVRNNSTLPTGAAGATGTVAFTTAPVAGSAATVTFGTPQCSSMTTGATCNPNGSVYLPAGGSVVFKVPFSTGAALGAIDLKAVVTLTAAKATDANLANNTAVLRLTVAEIIVEKTCMFTSYKQGKFLGNTSPDGHKNGWGTTAPFNPSAVPSMYSWVFYHLFDGWVSYSAKLSATSPTYTGMYLDPTKAKWKGTNKAALTTRTTTGGYLIGFDTVRPFVEVKSNGTWTRHWINYSKNTFVGGALSYSDYACGSGGPGGYYQVCPGPAGRVVPIGGPYTGIWKPLSDSKVYINYKSNGIDVNGVEYRQVWIERSPGPNCMAAGTTKATY